jgi:transposase
MMDDSMEEIIKTKADLLLEKVDELGKISLKEAAKILHVSVEQIDEWAKTLEEHGLVEIEYAPIHGMIIYSKKPKLMLEPVSRIPILKKARPKAIARKKPKRKPKKFKKEKKVRKDHIRKIIRKVKKMLKKVKK